MRTLAACFFTFILLVQVFYNLGVVAYWMANRAYIASNLCVKRAETNNCCKGACYLNKKLSEPVDSQDQDSPAMPGFKKTLEPAVFFLTVFSLTEPMNEHKQTGLWWESGLLDLEVEHRIFHPPA